MASIAEKKPLFPPKSHGHCGTQNGLFLPSRIQESPQPSTLVSLSPFRAHDKPVFPAKITALSKLPMMLPKALNSETRPLSSPETDCSTKLDCDQNRSSFGAEYTVISANSEIDVVSIMQNSTTSNGSTSIIHVGTITKEQEEQSLLQKMSKNGPPVSPRKCMLKVVIPKNGTTLPPKSPVKSFSTPESAVCTRIPPQKSRPNSAELGRVEATPQLNSTLSSPSKHQSSEMENMGRRPPTPPLKSPVKRAPKHESESSIDNRTEPRDKQPTPPPKSPLKSPSTTVNVCLLVPSKSTKVNVTQKPPTPPKFQSHNETRSSMRLIRIEPTIPTDTSSFYFNRISRLSLLEDAGDSHFPCSISPRTMRSMEFMFSFSDVDILEKLSDSWPAKCTHVVKEVIVTERAYVQSLTDVIKGYLTPLYSYVLKTGESPNFITTVFGNIVKIHQIHASLLESMQLAATSPENFARAFVDCDFITQYTLYCTGYSKGNKRLEQTLAAGCDIKEIIAECQKKLSHPLPLTSYLIKPVQRILKYPLLLEDLSKKFDWTDHPGDQMLKQALDKMSSVALQINTAFHDPVKIPKTSPKVIAQRRVNQIRDLQNSRSLDHNQISSIHYSLSHSNSHSLPHVNTRATLFPVPSPKHNSMTSFSYMEEKSLASAQQSSVHASANRTESGAKPGVKNLKGFYEKLTERSKEEMMMGRQRTGSNKMTRTNSMEDSFDHVPQPQVSRTSSLGNLLFRFGRSSNKTKDEPERKSLLRRFGKSKKSKSKV